MKRTIGVLCMLTGIMLLFGAFFLIMNNRSENQEAKDFSQNILPLIREEITLSEQPSNVHQTILRENIPEELLKPEDLVMTERIIEGYAYIGYLTISELDLELPVMSGWDSQRLQKAPCRFTGTLKGGDLVIMAHNYNAHFGRLSTLSEGSEVQFTDMDGNIQTYHVAVMDLLSAESVEEMTAGEYDLTLFTCAANRSLRVTVRCNKTD